MFDIGWGELLVIGMVALIAIGPKELPGVLRMLGQWMGKIRRMASEFQGQFQEAMREAEMADVKKELDAIGDAVPKIESPFEGTTFSDDTWKNPKPAEPAAPPALTESGLAASTIENPPQPSETILAVETAAAPETGPDTVRPLPESDAGHEPAISQVEDQPKTESLQGRPA